MQSDNYIYNIPNENYLFEKIDEELSGCRNAYEKMIYLEKLDDRKAKDRMIKWTDELVVNNICNVHFLDLEPQNLSQYKLLYKKKIELDSKDNDYNFFRYRLLPNQRYCIILKGVVSSTLKYTAGLFEFEKNVIVHFEQFCSGKKCYFNFVTGNSIKDLAFLVYAGVAGQTRYEKISVDSFEVYVI